MHARIGIIGAALGLAAAVPAGAQTLAFFSTQGSAPGVQVVDACSLEPETTITGLGSEPSRMVANADGSRIYVSSASQGSGRVFAIDTATREVVASAAAGLVQNRTIALSPDGTRVYTWKVTGAADIGVLVLDATDLSEVATVPLVGSNCVTGRTDVLVMPDGRIIANACSDGLRIIDPQTLAVAVGPAPPGGSFRMLGVSPDGAELYISRGGALGVSAGNTGVRAIDLATGTVAEFSWALPPSGSVPGFALGAAIQRLTVVKAPDAGPGDTYYYASYFSAGGSVPVAYARASDLAPDMAGVRNRRMIGLTVLPGTAVLGSADGRLGLAASGTGSIRRLRFLPGFQPPDSHIAPSSALLPFPGTSTLSDVIVLGLASLFCDGFES